MSWSRVVVNCGSDRSLIVEIKASSSSQTTSFIGLVPQGSVLVPVLFVMFISQIGTTISDSSTFIQFFNTLTLLSFISTLDTKIAAIQYILLA